MIIDVKQGVIELSFKNETLKIRHKTQLSFWGFEKNNETYVSQNLSDERLLKVIDYFVGSGFQVNKSEDCLKATEKINNKYSEFNNKLTELKRFKDGIYEEKEINKHIKSLSNLERELKDHQIKASFHLYNSCSGANFSVPGSGKTTVVLSVYNRLKIEKEVDSLFIIGPPSCFGPWQDEFDYVFGYKPSVTIFAGGDVNRRKEQYFSTTPSDINLSTFQTTSKDYLDMPKFLSNNNCLLVIDEAHYIKQIGGEWANAVLSLAPYSKYKVVLTGTPMPKGYQDFFNLFDFLYCDTPVLSNKKKLTLIDCDKKNNTELASNIINSSISPLFYRVRKKELGLAEQVLCDPIAVKMNHSERTVYDAIITKIKFYARNDYMRNIDYVERLILGRMMRLRQCLSYTYLLSNTIDEYEEDLLEGDETIKSMVYNYIKNEKPAKLIALINKVKDILKNDEKVLIWSNFIGTIELIEKELSANKIYSKKIIGATPTEKEDYSDVETREDIRKEFVDTDSDLRVLIANPAACAEAISLHKACNKAIYYDLSYNCAQFIQSLDRIHRVGGSEERPSYYYFLQYEDTIDSHIFHNIRTKSQKMEALIDQDFEIYSLDMFDNSDEIEAYKNIINE